MPGLEYSQIRLSMRLLPDTNDSGDCHNGKKEDEYGLLICWERSQYLTLPSGVASGLGLQ